MFGGDVIMEAMAVRIDVRYKVPDTRAEVYRRQFEDRGFKGRIAGVALADSYVVDMPLTAKERKGVAALFENPLVERAVINSAEAPKKFAWAVEIGFLPGVTDNVGTTARETIEDFLGRKFKNGQGVYSSQVFFLSGRLRKVDATAIAEGLYNPLIQRVRIKSAGEFRRDKGMGAVVPRVKLHTRPSVENVNLEVSDEELSRVGKEGIRNKDGTRNGPLALDLPSMKMIRDYFMKKKRHPTDVELESLAQTWSEHCKHTIFADPIDEVRGGLFRSYIKQATNDIREKKDKEDFCVSVFTDNSGAIAFDDKYLITHKVETHNSPSALDPFGGSVTGIVGVNRDTMGFGLGAKPVANLYGFCFADPRDTSVLYRDAEKKQKMLSARRIMDGVVKGVNVGGNCSGIPTPQGFVLFDKRYRGKPLVFVGTVGLIPRVHGGKPLYKKRAQPGDYIVMTGGRVGQDGIHGATFSSEAMDSGSPATAVQIGDPITQKKMSDALIKEARDRGLYHSITDNGAGGLSCSVAEMAKECNGCLVDLDKVPLKYPGLEPWKIWVSESQERMTLAVPKAKWPELSKLLRARGVEATVIGRFTNSGKCVVKFKGKTAMDIDLEFLHEGLPTKYLTTREPISLALKIDSPLPNERDLGAAVLRMLARPSIASYEFISMQYDHEVQASSVLKPLVGKGRVNADASVFRPVLDSPKGVVLSSGIVPTYSERDPYAMAACAIDTAIRSAVAAGADPDYLALLDNFCWCSSNEPERLFQLKRAVQACYDYAVAYGTPFISGKDSMFNDFKGYDEKGNPLKISIPPTLLISAIGVVPDAAKSVSLDAKLAGDLVYVLGETFDELGGSEYFSTGRVPHVDAKKNKRLYDAFYSCVRADTVASAISVARGGLAVALAKMAMAGKLGLDISLAKLPGTVSSDEAALFSESQGRIVATVAPRRHREFEKKIRGNPFACIGRVTNKEHVVIRRRKVAKMPLGEMLRAYKSTFKGY